MGVDTEKLAKTLNRALSGSDTPRTLRVMVQVNSSGEASKHGVAPHDCLALCKFIVKECERLELAGLMTIGAPDYSGCRVEDFETMQACRREVALALERDVASLELSMGMSNDFEPAVRAGSTSVRVGSSIFGARSKPQKSG